MLTKIYTFLLVIFSTMTMLGKDIIYTNVFSNVAESFYCETEIRPTADSEMHLRITDENNSVDITVSEKGAKLSVPKDSSFRVTPTAKTTQSRLKLEEVSKLSFRRYRNRCGIFLDGIPLISVTDCWNTAVSIQIDQDAVNADAEEYRQELGVFSFSDSFMIAEGDTNALRDWEKLSGEWTLHSVTGRTVSANDGKKLTKFPEPANSPNFYSLTGSGRCAVIAAGELFYSHYAVRAAIQQSEGTNGVAFLMTDTPSFWLFAVETDPSDGKLIFTLRDSCIPEESAGNVVKAVKTELYQGQWYMLEARTAEDEIVCSVDGIEIIHHRGKLPAGGMFGLFTDTDTTTRFDDVSAETYSGLNTADQQEAEYTELKGDLDGTRFFGYKGDSSAEISLPLSLKGDGDTLSIFIGQESKTAFAPAFTATATKTDGAVNFALQKFNAASNIFETVDSFSLSCNSKVFNADSFALDGRDNRFVTVRLNGTTIMLASTATSPTGAAGFKASSKKNSELIPKIDRVKSKYTDQFEKNKLYVTDPFMRHWASTAGQWLTFTNNTAWYKDDVLKHVTLEMPLIDNLELHLAVPDDAEEGALRIKTGTGILEIAKLDENGEYPMLCKWSYPSAQVNPNDGTVTTNTPVTFRLDGHRFAFLSATGSVFQCEIPFPHYGRRMFFKQVPQKYPGNIIVTRSPVIDCLFSESLHDWSINGGVWEVINRFQCLPKWSHMDGENPDSLAALWSKYEFSGDFSMTFIAGMRMGWYNRMGDMNLTLMNNSNSPSDGYTLSVTGWDPDESQRWSKLYRNGKEIASSDKYTVPRRRMGNIRKVYEPLLAGGRDVHGAWYAIRLRRNDKKLSFIFDNEKIFDVDDDAPLTSGSFGIWTYLNSMVVARVRLAADEIRPKAFPFAELSLTDYNLIQKAECGVRNAELKQTQHAPLMFNGLPVDFIRPEYWYSADDVSMPDIKFTTEDDEAVMTVTSTHGSGSFLAAPTERIAAVSGNFLAGWTFDVARSENALFNFEYSYSKEDQHKGFSHVISGYSGEKGERVISGSTPLPVPTVSGKKKIWTPVTVWLPATGKSPSTYVAKIEGFGNLQPSDIQKGILGNAPGEWFAVRRMRPIYQDTPSPDNSSENRAAFSDKISDALAAGKGGILNRFEVPKKIDASRPIIQWILPPPDNPGLIAEFSPDPEFMINVKSTLPWPNPMLSTSNVMINGVFAQHARIINNILQIPISRPFCPTSAPAVKVSFQTTSGRPFTQMLLPSVFADAGKTHPPVITSVTFPNCPNAHYESFESRTGILSQFAIDSQKRFLYPSLQFGDPVQGAYMKIANNGLHQNNLAAVLARAYDATKSPWFQFRYRGDDMAFVNMDILDRRYYSFSSLTPTTNVLGKSTLDNHWHTALCRLYDTDYRAPLTSLIRPQTTDVRIGANRIDERSENQTGLYSHFDIDEIAYGPALRKETLESFGFHAEFDAPSGITAAQYAVIQGIVPFDSRTEEEIKSFKWQNFDPTSTNTVLPSLEGLEEGVYHLVIRGLAGETVTIRPADIPFEIDTTPPAVTVSRGTMPEYEQRPALNISVDGGNGTPPTLATAKVLSENRPCILATMENASVRITRDNKIQIAINWPLVMRDEIQATTNGASVTLSIHNLADGAGNICQPIQESFKIDYASDKSAPPISKSSFRLLYGLPEMNTINSFFTSYSEHLTQKFVPAQTNQPAYVSLTVKKEANPKEDGKCRATAFFTQNGHHPQINWISTTNRWLLLRVRIPENATPPASGTTAIKMKFLVEKTPENSKNGMKSNHYTLLVPATNAPAAYIYGNLTFAPGKWTDIAIDVATALKEIIGTEKEVKITRYSLAPPAIPGYKLDIAQACIMANWNDKQDFNLNAYDPSGIKGVFIDGKFSHEGWQIKPATITPPDNKKFFYEITVSDRAGNMSPALVFPFPPPAPKTEAK